MVEVKEAPKPANPYARPTPIKCFKCNQMGYRSNDCPLKKAVHLAEREMETIIRFVVSLMAMKKMTRFMRMMMIRDGTMW